jgi:tRNA (cytidine/uridine-2'-O-)-methyltransferase
MDVLLYAPENPGNLGSIIRTSVGLGVDTLHVYDQYDLLSDRSRMHTTSRGHDDKVNLVSVGDSLEFMLQHEHRFATTLAKGSKRLGDPDYDVEIPEDSVIMFGNETRGLPRELSRRHDITRIAIPTRGMDYCLSLPVAYAIVLYEFLRQHPDHFPRRGIG